MGRGRCVGPTVATVRKGCHSEIGAVRPAANDTSVINEQTFVQGIPGGIGGDGVSDGRRRAVAGLRRAHRQVDGLPDACS